MKFARVQVFYSHPKTGVTSRSDDGSAMVHINYGNIDSDEASKALTSAMTEIESKFNALHLKFASEYAFPDGSLYYLIIVPEYMSIQEINEKISNIEITVLHDTSKDNSLNIFLDDERPPSETDTRVYTIVRSYDDFIYTVTKFGIPSFISFDHDLGPGKNGHDCVKWLIEFMLDTNKKQRINFTVHSQNPVGAENIRKLIDNWNDSL